MALYRWDVQKYVLTGLVPSGRYYWTNVHYVEAADEDEFDEARNSVFQNERAAHNDNVHFDRGKCIRLSDGHVMQNSSLTGVGELTTGLYFSLMATTLQQFRCTDDTLSYKRWRVPLRIVDIDGDHLSASYLANWALNGPDDAGVFWGYHTNVSGHHIVEAHLSPRAHDWQLRHGTKRSVRRRIV